MHVLAGMFTVGLQVIVTTCTLLYKHNSKIKKFAKMIRTRLFYIQGSPMASLAAGPRAPPNKSNMHDLNTDACRQILLHAGTVAGGDLAVCPSNSHFGQPSRVDAHTSAYHLITERQRHVTNMIKTEQAGRPHIATSHVITRQLNVWLGR